MPPAPSETALLLHDYLTARGLRAASTISLVMPFGIPIPPSPEASNALFESFATDIGWMPDRMVTGLDPDAKVAHCSDGSDALDLFLGVPVHRAPTVVTDSGLAVDGWIPVDPLTLETSSRRVRRGHATECGTPKAGVFAEGQAAVAAKQIIARLRGDVPTDTYDGHGVCYLGFWARPGGKVLVTFLSGEVSTGGLEGPSEAIATDKKILGPAGSNAGSTAWASTGGVATVGQGHGRCRMGGSGRWGTLRGRRPDQSLVWDLAHIRCPTACTAAPTWVGERRVVRRGPGPPETAGGSRGRNLRVCGGLSGPKRPSCSWSPCSWRSSAI